MTSRVSPAAARRMRVFVHGRSSLAASESVAFLHSCAMQHGCCATLHTSQRHGLHINMGSNKRCHFLHGERERDATHLQQQSILRARSERYMSRMTGVYAAPDSPIPFYACQYNLTTVGTHDGPGEVSQPAKCTHG